MEYKSQKPIPPRLKPRLIIHGGAGNVTPANLPAAFYHAYRTSLLTILSKANTYMHTPVLTPGLHPHQLPIRRRPSALAVATYAVTLLEDDPLYNSGRGAVFTRDGLNELEASVMVSRGRAKRGVGVSGLRRVRNPILLAREVLERGEDDLGGRKSRPPPAAGGPTETDGSAAQGTTEDVDLDGPAAAAAPSLDVPSAQGHTLVFGAAAEQLAESYGLEMVDQKYFFTQRRWDEHVRALQREKAHQPAQAAKGEALSTAAPVESATWSPSEYLPQGTCGAVALDDRGVVCVATSTGGMTNKLTGRVGDTPVVGAGFWAEEWEEDGPEPQGSHEGRDDGGPAVELSGSLRALMADCFPTPFLYQPVPARDPTSRTTITRSVAVSGTGNGDSFMRTAAARTVGAMARFGRLPSGAAVNAVAGPCGELQKSAGERWGKTGEGEGGMIGIECFIVRDSIGQMIRRDSEIIQAHNCGGMFRAWIDDDGKAIAKVWREDEALPMPYREKTPL